MKVLAALSMVAIVACIAVAWLIAAPVTPSSQTFIDFPLGTTSTEIAAKLAHNGLIRSKYAFLLLRITGGTLKAGEYRFADPASAIAIYNRICRGDVYTHSVVIPEGFNMYDIAIAVEAAGLGSRTSFLQAAHTNVDLIAPIAPFANSLEGYLYPDTYRFSRHITMRAMQTIMVRRFLAEIDTMGLSPAAGAIPRTVILASLVEKEVHFENERGLAAGVFVNRLNRGMPLQSDPTVIYAALLARRWTGIIHRSDLDFDSPYNTYRHTGLPPGPICSPGAAALRAASRPTSTDKLYFVADDSGHTQFSTSLREHTAKVDAYRNSFR